MFIKTLWLKFSLVVVILSFGFAAACGAQTAPSDLEDEPSLKFHLVYQDSFGKSVPDEEQDPKLPSNTKYYPYDEGSGEFVVTPAFLDETCLADVSAGQHPFHQGSVLNMTLNDKCAEEFMHVTIDNIGRRFAIVLNDELISAPRINAPIAGGSFYIDMGPIQNDSEILAKRFNAHINR